MESSTILYITLALIAALGFSFFHYLFPKAKRTGKNYIFFALRAISIFLVLILIINPKISSTELEVKKPALVVLADNSQSLSYLGVGERLEAISDSLLKNAEIRENFEVSRLLFGEQLQLDDSLNFSSKETNIYSALSEAEEIFSNSETAVILLTDGNQSLGRDYRYFKNNSSSSVFPFIIGDTTRYQDLNLSRINVNKYAFLKNRFPVEIFLDYSGGENIDADLVIRSGETVIFRQNLNFSENNSSRIVRTELPANSLGVKTYEVEILPVTGEKNTLNNLQKFAIEVIDERTSVLLITDITHPDLGAFKKAIESNQQRNVDIQFLNDKNLEVSEYQLIIVYQVNRRFNSVMANILENDLNYLMVTGTKTDWNYLNNLDLGYTRKATSQSQEIFPVYDHTFSSFQFEDIGFDDFPPLLDKFGALEFDQEQFNIMLSQEIQGIETGEPLIGVSQSNPKSGFIFGENIWRWRSKAFLDNQSFQEFDEFIGKLVQNLASKTTRQRLTVEVKNFYYANENVLISAQYFDENYQFDPGANLSIEFVNNETKESFTSDLLLENNFFQFDGGDLEPGIYDFTISVEGKNLARSGTFEVIDFNTEQQFVSSNLSGMQSFADYNGTRLFYPGELNQLINTLLNSDKFKPVQKSRQKTVPLIDWYFLLFILIFVLAAEWFYRKYLGLI
ncbi:VWA domain-containing protein [Gramella lutea]|uniref:VWA domain-containing protein n=1 Tax=Christiangramia lutea TaxID=1607951 RepID=A0A9X1V5Y9_9FLAO|nr:VWA domain-containing protein [Christiangramia lutea]MCH4823238.1 VWA domain-containing protein [Christiangramia lutea]